MNRVEATEEVFGQDAVMGGNARVGAELVAPGVIVHRTGGLIEFGELDGRDTPRAQRTPEQNSSRRVRADLPLRSRAQRRRCYSLSRQTRSRTPQR